MPILSERKTWAKPRPPGEHRHASDLTPEEKANVRLALRFLRVRAGGVEQLAAVLKVKPKLIANACGVRGKPSAGLAIRAARMAGASVEDVLSGAFPPPGTCPHCGRTEPIALT